MSNAYKVNSNLSTKEKISLINNMVIANEGKIGSGEFNKNEIDNLYANLSIDRKFKRNILLGNTLTDYTDWSHLKEESGYSIWKITPADYSYNSLNKLYFDDKELENRGQAGAESATTFDKVYLYDGSSYTDNTTEAGIENGTEFNLMSDTGDYLYIGSSSTFSGIKFEFQTRGSEYNLKVEYYDESSGVNDWVELTANTNNLDDDTNNFESDGKISWTIPDSWGTTIVNSVSKYWIRISTTSSPVTIAKAYYIIPYNSVIALLALSSTQIQNEDWAWCSYGGSIYVTIRNTGNTAYEGDYYITSSSSTTNLKNFFIYNHTYKANYEDSTYDPVVTITSGYTVTGNEGIILANGTFVISLPTAVGIEGKKVFIKNIGTGTITVQAVSGQTIDGNNTKDLSTQYSLISIVSDGSNWVNLVTETDPIVGAVNGVVKADGAGNISAATTDNLPEGSTNLYFSGKTQDDLGDGTTYKQYNPASVSITGGSISGITDLAVVDGGTGKSSWTQYLIPYADTSTSFSQIAAGTSGQILTSNGDSSAPSFQDAPGGGGKYGINVETLSADKTLTPGTDEIYQYLDEGGANRTITLDTSSASAGDRFVIRHNGYYTDAHYLKVQQDTTPLDYLHVGSIKEFIFDGTNWISAENGSGESDNKKWNIAIGYSSMAHNNGTAVGASTHGYNNGTAVGLEAQGHSEGTAVGKSSAGSSSGVAIGYSAYGNTAGVSVGYQANGDNYGIGIGYKSRGKYNGTSIGYEAGYNSTVYANPNKNILLGYKAGYNLTQPSAWAASTAYSVGDYVRPTSANGYNYECTVAGTSGTTQPTWPTTLGDTVSDGGVTWKCVSMRGNNNIIIGYDIEGSANDADKLNIGNLIYGDLTNGNIGIGATEPDYKAHIDGTIGVNPGSSVTPQNNGDIVVEATNNTTLTFKLKGSDGVVRSGTITLS